MEDQTDEEVPQTEEPTGENEEEEEELTDVEIVELEEEADHEAQVDAAVNVELGADTVTEADVGLTDEAAGEEVTEAGHGEDDEGSDLDELATDASEDHVDVLEAPRTATEAAAAAADADTVALEDAPSRPDTLGPGAEEDEAVRDERDEYAVADETDVMPEEYEKRPSTVFGQPCVPGDALIAVLYNA